MTQDPPVPAPRMPEVRPAYAGPNIEQLYTRKDIMHICRLSRSAINRMVVTGEFPPPINLSSRTLRWRRSDIITWQESL